MSHTAVLALLALLVGDSDAAFQAAPEPESSGGSASSQTAAGDATAPPLPPFGVDYLALYEEGVNQLPTLDAADLMILAALWSRTGNETYAAAAARNLAGIATGDAPWLAANKAWADPVNGRQSWIDFDRNTTTFCSTSAPGACHGAGSSGFLGCTEYGLLAYLVLQRGGYDKGWSAQVESDYKVIHSTLCYVWFSGAWNQVRLLTDFNPFSTDFGLFSTDVGLFVWKIFSNDRARGWVLRIAI